MTILDSQPDSGGDIDSRYAWTRLALSVVLGTIACVGTWSVVVVLPTIEVEFDTIRGGASLPYTCTMLGFAAGSAVMGRLADRFSIVAPICIGAVLLCAGYVLAAFSSDIWQFALVHGLFIGVGSASGFAPLMSDLSHWFRKRRALAVTIAASGSYAAGTVWPLVVEHFQVSQGWRATYVGIGLFVPAAMLPLAFLMRRRPVSAAIAEAESTTREARVSLGLSPRALQGLLVVAGFACCTAMSMPQVHLVAYCGDLGYGVAIGTQILSLMLGLGIISRLASGLAADRIGGGPMLLLGSAMQAAALLLYLFFNSLSSLYVISGLFGLFQGGIVPMYAVIIRQFLPPREAGARIGFVIMATILGMAFGGLSSGLIFDASGSYRLAFLHGFLWNCVNLALVAWLILRPRAKPRAGEAAFR
ncbi:MFS transporter [Labrys monachus]|uniref:MFS family permease n=1 Tax=Labrys monachus TaxID=217067 RepID=A0ABU0F9E8_9HYPH|nr:MFS transporter [Labrys monachus]MDQ0391242.1 MFS family permease [Labrys monachus]